MIKLVRNWTVGLLLLCTPSLHGQGQSKNSLWPNGLNAAAFTDISIDQGTINGATISNLRLLAGFQLYRLWDVLSLSLGYGKVGFYDAVHDWDDAINSFQLNYQGPTIGIEFAPNWPVSFEIIHFYNPGGKAVERLADSDNPDNLSGDLRARYNYDVQDTTLYLGIRVWDNLRMVLGMGNRTLDYTYEVTNNNVVDDDLSVGGKAKSGSESEPYILLGIRGTQVLNW